MLHRGDGMGVVWVGPGFGVFSVRGLGFGRFG